MAGHHTTVIVEQPTFVKNPKLIGSVYGTREWSSGICGCCTDGKSFIKTCCCLQCVICELSRRTGECCLMPWFVPGGLVALRTSIRRLGGITGSICYDCIAVWRKGKHT